MTPDSFWEPSRRNMGIFSSPVDIVDIGAVSTRPGAAPVSCDEEWHRLAPALTSEEVSSWIVSGKRISIDTTRSEIVRRAHEVLGNFIVNDISAGEDDPDMLETVSALGLSYVAMHKRGNPQTMDSMCDYPDGIIAELLRYFGDFSKKAEKLGIKDWIVDPGLGFAKTESQNVEILERLSELKSIGRPILVGISDKRFTHGRNRELSAIAIRGGADILRVHDYSEVPL